MPITLEQPGMVSPQITSAYGAALQFSQDAPTMANLAGQTAQLNQQAMARGDQMRLANAALGAQSANEQADRYWRSQAANADRESTALNVGASLNAQADNNLLHANTGIIQQQRGAELAVWANGQEMTQGENMRLQRLNEGLDHVMSDPNLGEPGVMTPERSDLVTQLRTGIDPLRQKAERAQTKMTEAHTQIYQQQLAQEVQKQQALKQNEITMQDFEAKAKEQGKGVMRWADPETGKQHLLIQNPKSGVWENPLQNAGGGVDKSMESDMKHFETEHKSWLSQAEAYHKAFSTERSAIEKYYSSPEGAKRIEGGEIRRPTDEELDDAALKRVKVPAPGPEPTAPNRRGQQPSPQPGQQTQGQAAPSPEMIDFHKKVAADNTPFEIGKGNPQQNARVKDLDDMRAGIRTVPGLNDQSKNMFEDQASTAIKLLTDFGSRSGMELKNPQAGQLFDAISESLKRIASQAQPREDQKPPQPKRPAESYRRDMKLEAK